jgi:hypothetical protein
MFRLHYNLRDNGDGSASAVFYEDEKALQKEMEEMEEGWGEPCDGHVDLVIKDNKIYRKKLEWNSKAKEYNEVLIPLEQVD